MPSNANLVTVTLLLACVVLFAVRNCAADKRIRALEEAVEILDLGQCEALNACMDTLDYQDRLLREPQGESAQENP